MEPFEQKQNIKKKALLYLALSIAFLSFFVPLPYYLEVPGDAMELNSFVSVNGKRDQEPGAFMLTTVGIRPATAAMVLASYFQPNQELVSKTALMGDSSNAEYNQMQQYYMQSSQNTAIEVALQLADKPYTMDYLGVYVMSILKNSSFVKQLKVGDTVNKVNGESFENAQQFIDVIKDEKVGSKITIGYLQDNEQKEASGELILLENGNPGIGITLVDHTEIESPEKIDIQVGPIGGPSAGLMFTLEVYDMLTGYHLRKGRYIAGTGTIEADGHVGSIGGIDKKIIAASKAGAEIFFAPNEPVSDWLKEKDPNAKNNYEIAKETAEKIGTSMIVVPVLTVQDAISYLEK